ncbi:peptide deformylase [Elusimicrobium simillimum]|uniref:peptide deformylase n=1 Tax=Elusimicrobium simillimum TaxID=3143438 RepID=UPI003C6FAFF0
MAIRKIVKYGDDILKEKLKPVDFKELEPILPELLKDMEDTCIAAAGAGLAANQIGLRHRIAIILVPEKDKLKKGEMQTYKRFVLINPKIISKAGEIIEEEGCLSFPGLYVEVPRAREITVRFTNEKGLPMEARVGGFLAKAFQHEIDHLDGKVFIDHADPAIKPALKKELKTLSKNWS